MPTPVSILTLPADPVIGPVRRPLKVVRRSHFWARGSYGVPIISVTPLVGITKVSPAPRKARRTRMIFSNLSFAAGKLLWYGDDSRPKRGQLWPRTR